MSKAKPAKSWLTFIWYESDSLIGRHRYWGELIGSTHALRFVADELRDAIRVRNLRRAMEKLEYNMQNYFARAYELRERALLFLNELHPGYKAQLGKLKKPAERAGAVSKLSSVFKTEMPLLINLLSLLDDDMALRNRHTHETFLTLSFNVDGDIYDAESVVFNYERRRDERLLRAIRRDMRLSADDYAGRIDAIVKVTLELLMLHQPHDSQ